MSHSTPRTSDPVVDYGLSATLDKRPLRPTLREAAKHLILPDGIESSLWPRIRYRLGTMGTEFDRWQEGLGKAALGLDSRGTFACTVGGVTASIPRQVGKSFFVANLLIGLCIELPGLRCLWTSHHGKTTSGTFQDMQAIAKRPAVQAHLKPRNGITTAAGNEGLHFANGSMILFGAREHGFGRGMPAIDVIVFDEAQILGLKALEDMVPTTNAAKNPHGALLFFIGTPPRPVDDGAAFKAKRRNALDGTMRDGLFVEISGDAKLGDHEPRNLRMANPSYPSRVPPESMKRMRANLPDSGAWRREALGIWDLDDVAEVPPVLVEWPTRVTPRPDPTLRPDGFGVDRHPLLGWSVAACWNHVDGTRFVEEVFAHHDTDVVADWLAKATTMRSTIFVDAMSAAAPIIPMMKARRRVVLKSNTAEMIAACSLINEGTSSGTLGHSDQPRMQESIDGAQVREIRSASGTGWGWGRRYDSAPIYRLIAASLAVLAASRRPTPKLPTTSSGGRRGR